MRFPALEVLEGRALLAAATLDLASPTDTSTLSYSSSTPSDDLTITVSVVNDPTGFPVRNYTFHNSAAPMRLGQNAIAFGWVAVDANTVTGPSTSVSDISITENNTFGSAADIVNIDQSDAPITIDSFSGGPNTVNIGDGTVQGIAGEVNLNNFSALTGVTVNDSSDPITRAATLMDTSDFTGILSGLAAQGINFTPSQLSGLTIDTGSGGNSLTVDFSMGNPVPPGTSGLAFNGGVGGDTLNLQGNGGFQSEGVSENGNGAGTISLVGPPNEPMLIGTPSDPTLIGFSALKDVNDSVPVPTFTFSAPPGPQALDIVDGPQSGSVTTTTIQSNSASFPPLNFTDKTNVTVKCGFGNGSATDSQSVTLNNPTAAIARHSLNVVTGNANNTVTLTAAGVGRHIVLAWQWHEYDEHRLGRAVERGSTAVHGGSGTATVIYDANGLPANVNAVSVSAGSGTAPPGPTSPSTTSPSCGS